MTLKFKKNKRHQHLCDQIYTWLVNDLSNYGVVHVDVFAWCPETQRFNMASCNVHWAIHCHEQNQQTLTQSWGEEALFWLPSNAPLAKAWAFWHGSGQSLLWRQHDQVFHLVFRDWHEAMPWFSCLERTLAHGRYLIAQHGKYIKPHQMPWFSADWFSGWSQPPSIDVPSCHYQKGEFAGLMLTAKEQMHLDYLALGFTYKEIAYRRGVSNTAVQMIYANIKRKINAPKLSNSQLLIRLRDYGFVPLVGGDLCLNH
ncbi:MAG: hypothetical protein ISP86_05995 [Shewanellaceae bacterium]|nr:hypothetical protein [Shewanellaceae bacterium]